MSGRRSTAEWRAVVFLHQDPRLTQSARVLLLYLADHMDRQRFVSVPRSRIAQDLGVHERRIPERLKSAMDAGLLDRVVTGHIGVTSVYQGIFPSPSREGAVERTLSEAKEGAPEQHPKGAVERTLSERREGAPEQHPSSNTQLQIPGELESGEVFEDAMHGIRNNEHNRDVQRLIAIVTSKLDSRSL